MVREAIEKPTRRQVGQLVVSTVRTSMGQPNVTEATRFWDDLGLDKESRRGFFVPIKTELEAQGWPPHGITAADMETCVEVADMSDKFYVAVS